MHHHHQMVLVWLLFAVLLVDYLSVLSSDVLLLFLLKNMLKGKSLFGWFALIFTIHLCKKKSVCFIEFLSRAFLVKNILSVWKQLSAVCFTHVCFREIPLYFDYRISYLNSCNNIKIPRSIIIGLFLQIQENKESTTVHGRRRV